MLVAGQEVHASEKKEEGIPKKETMKRAVESEAQTTTKERFSKSLERPVTQQSTTSLRGESRQEKVSFTVSVYDFIL